MVIVFLFTNYYLYKVWKTGKALASKDEASLGLHKKYHKKFFAALFLSVFLVESIKLLEGEHWNDTELFQWHIHFVIAFLVNTFLMFWFNGKTWPKTHGTLWVVFFHVYIFMAATGAPLVYELVKKYH